MLMPQIFGMCQRQCLKILNQTLNVLLSASEMGIVLWQTPC